MNGKAQASLEFIMMVSFAGLALIIFTGAAYQIFEEKLITSKEQRVKDFGSWLQEEIVLASKVHPGYEREITLPKDINGIPYEVSFSGDFLYVSYERGDVPFPIPDVTGSLTKGDVTIRNVDGNVQVS